MRPVLPPLSTWHQTLPGFDRLLEARWEAKLRRAPVLSPEEHAARYKDPDRRGAAIEIPIDPERLGDLYATGRYAKFLAGEYAHKRIRRYEVTMAPFGPLFAAGDGRRLLDFGCGHGLFLELAQARGFDGCGVDLAKDGVLLILTVNADSLILRRRLERWAGFTVNHLLFSSPRTLPRLLERAGFGAVVMPPWYSEPVEVGRSKLTAREQRRLRNAVDHGNRGNMLRAAAFADPAGPARWGLDDHVVALQPDPRVTRALHPA